MPFRRLQTYVAVTIVAVGTTTGSVASQDMPHRTTSEIERQQLGSIAEEAAGKLKRGDSTAVLVFVQPSVVSGLAENAFVEALQRRGYRVFLKPQADSLEIEFTVSILTSGAQFREIGPTAYERTVHTQVEARTDRSTGEAVAVLGIFERLSTDTVSAQEATIPVPGKGEAGDEDASLFQRLVGPLVILASGMMIVYLFFTVRS